MNTDDRDPGKNPETPPTLEESIELLRAARIELQAAMLAESLAEARKAGAIERPAGKTRTPDPWPH